MKTSIASACATTALVTALATGLFATPGAQAQAALGTPAEALAEARQRLVCGTGTVVDATYLPGGQRRATCRAQSNETLPQELQGTELTTAQIGAVAAAALLVVIVATGGDDDSTTTTTGSTAASE